jgi:ubiquinone/menaquinone biosynthesis C-methylase UbiE
MAPEDRVDEVAQTYDTVAASYAERIPGLSAESTLEIALIDSFAARVLASGGGPVIDAGSGPGRVTAYLQSLGLDVSGIDLSPGMVEVARERHPDLHFSVGSLRKLDVADRSLAGLLAWYSTIHTPLDELGVILAEFRRVLRSGGFLLMGFHVGSGVQRITQSYGHEVGIDLQLFPPERIAELLVDAGFVVLASLVREPEGRERRPQGFLLAS